MAQPPHGPGQPESGDSRSPRGLGGDNPSPELDTDVDLRAARAHPHPQKADSGAGVEAAGREMREQAEHIGRQASEQARALVDEQKGVMAREVHGLAEALHSTARQLGAQEQRPLSSYVERAAHGLDRFADNLEGRSGESLLHQVQDYARRQPGMFIGGAVAAGLVLSRFLKSSRQDHGPGGSARAYPGDNRPPGAGRHGARADELDELPHRAAGVPEASSRAHEAVVKADKPVGPSTSKNPGGTDEGR